MIFLENILASSRAPKSSLGLIQAQPKSKVWAMSLLFKVESSPFRGKQCVRPIGRGLGLSLNLQFLVSSWPNDEGEEYNPASTESYNTQAKSKKGNSSLYKIFFL